MNKIKSSWREVVSVSDLCRFYAHLWCHIKLHLISDVFTHWLTLATLNVCQNNRQSQADQNHVRLLFLAFGPLQEWLLDPSRCKQKHSTASQSRAGSCSAWYRMQYHKFWSAWQLWQLLICVNRTGPRHVFCSLHLQPSYCLTGDTQRSLSSQSYMRCMITALQLMLLYLCQW